MPLLQTSARGRGPNRPPLAEEMVQLEIQASLAAFPGLESAWKPQPGSGGTELRSGSAGSSRRAAHLAAAAPAEPARSAEFPESVPALRSRRPLGSAGLSRRARAGRGGCPGEAGRGQRSGPQPCASPRAGGSARDARRDRRGRQRTLCGRRANPPGRPAGEGRGRPLNSHVRRAAGCAEGPPARGRREAGTLRTFLRKVLGAAEDAASGSAPPGPHAAAPGPEPELAALQPGHAGCCPASGPPGSAETGRCPRPPLLIPARPEGGSPWSRRNAPAPDSVLRKGSSHPNGRSVGQCELDAGRG